MFKLMGGYLMTSGATLQKNSNPFTKIWPGGYFEGDPLDPTSGSSYGVYGFNSVLYTIYLTCIKPYVTSKSVVLEIGPGRGAWTKAFLYLGVKAIWCLDAAPAEHTRFYEYIGYNETVKYICVNDANLKEIEDNTIDYFFSFGVFCHIPQDITKTYLENLASKMKAGSNGFLMVGDFEKYNKCIENSITIFDIRGKWMMPFRILWKVLSAIFPDKYAKKKLNLDDLSPLAGKSGLGRWYHLSTNDACVILESCGFTVVDSDMNVSQRDPVIHFTKLGSPSRPYDAGAEG